MVGEAEKYAHRSADAARFYPELWSSTSLAIIAVLTHRTGVLCLDKTFDLIEGHPPRAVQQISLAKRLSALSRKSVSKTHRA